MTDKNMSETFQENTKPEPKKRGRKPKIITEPVIPEPKKKRGRKPSNKIYENTVLTMPIHNDCIIASLPLTLKDVSAITGTEYVDSDNDEPSKNVKIVTDKIGFTVENDFDVKQKLNEKNSEIEQLRNTIDDLKSRCEKFTYLESIMSDNGSVDKKYHTALNNLINENGKWKVETDQWCSWCCHPFVTVPIGLPEKKCNKTGKIFVTECFCSFNCAHAFNINMKDEKLDERLSLLHQIKKQIYKGTEFENKPINYAGPRKLLKVFGGSLSIDEYRGNYISIPKDYVLLMPPLIPYVTLIEEIPKYFNHNKQPIYSKIKKTKTIPTNIKKNNLMSLLT